MELEPTHTLVILTVSHVQQDTDALTQTQSLFLVLMDSTRLMELLLVLIVEQGLTVHHMQLQQSLVQMAVTVPAQDGLLVKDVQQDINVVQNLQTQWHVQTVNIHMRCQLHVLTAQRGMHVQPRIHHQLHALMDTMQLEVLHHVLNALLEAPVMIHQLLLQLVVMVTTP